MTDDRAWLRDILDAITRIERYAIRGREAFERDELVQTWIIHHLQIMGEAARNLSKAFRTGHPDIPWPQIIAMRNILVHHYFGIDLDEVWNTVEGDLPVLAQQITNILGE